MAEIAWENVENLYGRPVKNFSDMPLACGLLAAASARFFKPKVIETEHRRSAADSVGVHEPIGQRP
jgi:hypothetical protein